MANLARAIEIASTAHRDQTRKNGDPYVLHPLRLMFQVEGDLPRMAAVLHDVVEDTDWTLEDLKSEGFPEELIEALDLLTHRDGVPYEEFVMQLATNEIARQVKLADLRDNINLLEIPELSDRGLERARKYHRFERYLSGSDTSLPPGG